MKTASRVAAVVTGLALAFAGTVGLASTASAAYLPTPIGPAGPTAFVPDGPVTAMVTSGAFVYVGGAFTGGVAKLDADGGLVWRASANGGVRALAVSSDGSRVLAGGAFTQVSGATHRKLAALDASTGAAVSTWRASAGGTVRDIVVNGDTAYFGGAFTTQNGQAQGGLGAVTVSTGKLVPDFTATTDGNVYSLAMTGSRLVIGGKYTAVNGQPRSQLASVDVATNTLDSWAPVRACTGCNVYWDLTIDGNTVYTANRNAGAVTALGLTNVLTPVTPRWTTTANGDAQAVTVVNGELYVGGHFTTIRGPRQTAQSRTIVARLDPASGAVLGFAPRFVTTYPGVWALDATSSRLYVGGHFTAAGPSPPKQFPYFAVFGN